MFSQEEKNAAARRLMTAVIMQAVKDVKHAIIKEEPRRFLRFYAADYLDETTDEFDREAWNEWIDGGCLYNSAKLKRVGFVTSHKEMEM